MAVPADQLDAALARVGSRLKQLRLQRGITLAALSRETGISVSTLSRLEAGLRRPTLELLLPIARAHQVSLDDIVGGLLVDDPRIPAQAQRVADGVVVPLSRHAGGLQAFKMTIPVSRHRPDPRTHQGYEWLYVLSGRLRLVVAQHDVVLDPGEAAEFDTRTPHWFGSTGQGPVEILSLFGPQGERVHLRVRPRRTPDGTPPEQAHRSRLPA
jgi:transcriptional regulator with XRE-family HTH domain